MNPNDRRAERAIRRRRSSCSSRRPATGRRPGTYDTGPDRYRRALYTFRFRSVPYPVLQNFDAPNGDFACVRRARSNTPLQALTTLNEPLFVECARALALKIVAEGGATDAERLAYAVRRCLSREPHGDELKVLQDFLDRQRQRFDRDGADPWPLLADDDKPKQTLAAELPAGSDARRPRRLDGRGPRGAEPGRNDYEGVSSV